MATSNIAIPKRGIIHLIQHIDSSFPSPKIKYIIGSKYLLSVSPAFKSIRASCTCCINPGVAGEDGVDMQEADDPDNEDAAFGIAIGTPDDVLLIS